MSQRGSCSQTAFASSCISRAPQDLSLPSGYQTAVPWVPPRCSAPQCSPTLAVHFYSPL